MPVGKRSNIFVMPGWNTGIKIEKFIRSSYNYRWRIVALLFFATTINYIDRQVIGILKPYISDDLGWSEVDYGYIVMTFQIAYAIGLITTGRFLDKFGTRLGYTLAIILWSIASTAHAAARSVLTFSLMRFFWELENQPISLQQ